MLCTNWCCRSFKCAPDSNGLVVIKLKSSLTYKDHVCFEPVWSELLNLTLMYLKEDNPLCSDVVLILVTSLIIYYRFANDDIPRPNKTFKFFWMFIYLTPRNSLVPSLLTGDETEISVALGALREMYPNMEFFLVRIFLYPTEYGDLRSKFPYSVRIQENTDKKKLLIWTLFT